MKAKTSAGLIPRCIRALRLIPPGTRGKARLARLLLRNHLDVIEPRVVGADGCSYFVPSLREPIAFHLLIDGIYEPDLAGFLDANLSPGDTFVDVGANIGAFTIPGARRVGPSGKVLAIEASPSIFPYLKRNVSDNRLENVVTKHCAASDSQSGEVPFYDAPHSHFGMGSLAPQFHANPVKVPAQTIDDLLAEEAIDRVKVLKVDVEGFEVNVFKGAQSLLTSSQPPCVIFEFCDWAENRAARDSSGEAQRYLQKLRYELFRLDNRSRLIAMPDVLTTGFATIVARRS
jgi:FkbM family methyltransferase